MTRTMPAAAPQVSFGGGHTQRGRWLCLTGVDLAVLRAVAEDGRDLRGPAAVERAGGAALLADGGAGGFQPQLRADDLMQHAQHRGVIDQQARGAARHVPLLGRQALRVLRDAQHLVPDRRDLLRPGAVTAV